MITFETETIRFTYRVAGIAIHDSHLLLEYSRRHDFWFLPGGRGELLEPSRETILREMYEELGTTVCIERLLWIVENFFIHRGRGGHEIAFYFLITIPPDPSLHNRTGPFTRPNELGDLQTFQWWHLDQLEQITLYPTFLKQHVLRLPHTVEHIIHTDAQSAAALATIREAHQDGGSRSGIRPPAMPREDM
jgi:8-oxo-dGTP pyrophosphatase MutT (NUDIX family)